MGEVYRARDPRLGREVAIKVLPSRLMQDSEALSRFEREAKAVAALSHPNVLAIHDIGRHEGIAYAVMELLEGDTLRRKLDAGPVSLREAIDLAMQTTNGLSAAHEKGIVHRDLKPENLFVTGDGRVKILDFGLAKRIQEVAVGEETTAPTQTGQTTPGTVMGTLGYMSPEQVRGLPLDHRSDIFSFGVVLYEMVTGRRPFPGSSAAEVAGAILHAEPALDDAAIPATLKPVIRRLLEKDPAKRYAGIREVNAELRSLEESLAPARSGRLSRNARIAVAAAVVAATIAVAWFWHRSSRARWALETAAPEIRRLLAAEDFARAMTLTREARAVLPKDPTLESPWNQTTREVSIRSDPPGAEVSMRPYQNAAAWERLGPTPLEKIRVPRNSYQHLWRIAKPGFATAYRIGAGTSVFRLHPQKSVPPEMLVVSGGDIEIEIPGLDNAPTVPLEDYLLDRHEVTNEEFKKFVDAGGYQDRRFWKQAFVKDGRTVAWDEALAMFRDTTGRPGPATWEVGAFPKGMEKHPVAGVSWYEATAYAEFAGKVLPTIYHWNHAAQTPLGSLMVRGSNFRGAGTQPVESPGSLSGFGTADMAGNVKEWCWNEGRGGKRFILGGGFGEPEYMFIDEDAQSPWDRRPNFGFRCAKLFSPPPDSALGRFDVEFRDYSKEKPVSDEVFSAFKRPYVYDRRDLDARVEESKTTPDWVREKVTFSAAYGDERVIAYLYLPKTGTPPLQAVVFFPGSGVIFQDKFDDQQSVVWDFVVRSGRVLMFPIFKSTLERRDGLRSDVPQPTANWRDHMILWSKDLSRSVDYLETRKDIDRSKLGYFGLSWGAAVAPILLATEERFQAAILEGGGLAFQRALPEADPINFVTRVGAVDFRRVEIDALQVLGGVATDEADFKRDEALARERLALARALHPDRHPEIAEALDDYGVALTNVGDLKGAEKSFLEAIEIERSVLGDDHPALATTRENLGNVYFKAKRLDETARNLELVLAMRRKALGDDSEPVARTLANMATVYYIAGNLEAADRTYVEALERLSRKLGPDHPDVAATLAAMGSLYTKERKFAEAEAFLRRALEIRLKAFGETNALTQITIKTFVGLYMAWNRPAEAAAYRARLAPAGTKAAPGK